MRRLLAKLESKLYIAGPIYVQCATTTNAKQGSKSRGGTDKQEEERKFYQWVLKQLVDNVAKYKDGVMIKLYDGTLKWLVPYISHVITDWPEGQQMCGMKQGASSSER